VYQPKSVKTAFRGVNGSGSRPAHESKTRDTIKMSATHVQKATSTPAIVQREAGSENGGTEEVGVEEAANVMRYRRNGRVVIGEYTRATTLETGGLTRAARRTG
jgi:hypothetical protein